MAFDATARAVFRTVMVVLAVVLTLYVVYLLRQPLSWLIIALFVAVAISGPVNLLSRHMRRGFAITIAYLGLLMIPVALGAILVPSIAGAVGDLAESVPQYADDLQEFVRDNDTLRDIDDDYQVTEKIEEQASRAPEKIGDAAGLLADVGAGLVSSIFAGVTILILSIFMVASGTRWVDSFLAMHPPDRAARLRRVLERSGNAVGAYVAGALLQATIAGVTTFILLKILGVPFAGALAVVVFFFDLIPLVGATIAAFLVGIVTVFNDFPTDTIVWVLWAIIYQQVENTVIQPRIQSRAVQVQPFIVLVAVLFGSTLFGIIGALLAIPAAASLQIGIREYLAYRKDLQAYRQQEKLVPGGGEPPQPPVGPTPADAPT